jgi:hypothetical protein
VRRKIFGFAVGLFGASLSAKAALTVSIGHDYITPGATQSFPISVSDTDNAQTDDIEGMTFTLQIGSGTGSTPSIVGADLLTNTVWKGLVSGPVYVSTGGNTPQFVSQDLITDNAGEYLGEYNSPSGTLATFTVNTAGATPGNYSLLLVGTLDPGSDSQFIDGSGNTVPAVFNAGILTVQAVPEPLGLGIAAAGMMLALRRSRRSF